MSRFYYRDAEFSHELTISDLLAHKISLAASSDWLYGADGVLPFDNSQIPSAFGALKSVGPLWTLYDYSNWNYAVLGADIERASGQSYGNYLNEDSRYPWYERNICVTTSETGREYRCAVCYAR